LTAAVALGALVGPAQVGSRVIEMAGKGKHHPLWTMTAALVLVAVGLGLLTLGLGPISLAILLYGAGNGVFSIAKGTVPLAVFGPDRYAPIVGRLARPSLVAQALAPAASAWILEYTNVTGVYGLLLLLSAANMMLCVGLWARFRAARK